MKVLAVLMAMLSVFPDNEMTIAFGNDNSRTNSWSILSDNVMGGRSEASLEYSGSAVILKGNVSFENRGGFVSIKSKFSNFDLSKYKSISIRFRAIDQQYAFTLENSRRWYEPAYKYDFSAKVSNTWETVTLPLNEFREEVIGRPTGKKVDENILKGIIRLGITTAEKKEGPFQLEIESIVFK